MKRLTCVLARPAPKSAGRLPFSGTVAPEPGAISTPLLAGLVTRVVRFSVWKPHPQPIASQGHMLEKLSLRHPRFSQSTRSLSALSACFRTFLVLNWETTEHPMMSFGITLQLGRPRDRANVSMVHKRHSPCLASTSRIDMSTW